MTKSVKTWQKICNKLQTEINPSNYELWIANLRPHIANKQLTLFASNRFISDWVEQHYLNLIVDHARLIEGDLEIKIEFESSEISSPVASTTGTESVRQNKKPTASAGSANMGTVATGKSQSANGSQSNGQNRLRSHFTFENYVIGPNNQFASTVSEQVAAQPGTLYNPLYVYGGTALGKTHLIQAIGHKILEAKPESKVHYMSTSELVNQIILSFREQDVPSVHQKLLQYDVLLLDDIQSMAGKNASMQIFFEIFNELYNSHRQIVLTSDVIPNDIDKLEERIQSRFNSGLLAEITPPGLETRINILHSKINLILERQSDSQLRYMEDETILYIAENVVENVRELEGALNLLNAKSMVSNERITRDFVADVLAHRFNAGFRTVTGNQILALACRHFHVSEPDIKSKQRHRSVALPRQIVMYLCKEMTGMSYPDIGKLLKRDHSTVLHGVQKITDSMLTDRVLKATVETLKINLKR